MFDDLFIRVASERLAREADAIAALDAGPEIYIRAEELKSFTPPAIAVTRRLLKNFRKSTVHAPFMDVWPGAADEDVRRLSLEKMKRTMGIAADLESTLVVMHFNYDPIYYRQQFPQWLERAASFFSTLLAEHAGPLIALENIAEPTPYIVLRLLKQAGQPRLVHCFDFGHHHVFGRIPFAEWLFYLAPQSQIHFHLHDNPGDFDEHLALGQGSIDWQEVKTTLAGMPCPFSIALEPKSPEILISSAAYYRQHFLSNS